MLAFFSAMTGAVVGGLIALFVQRWRFSVDRWSATADELCKDTIALGDQGSEFWLSERKRESTNLALQQVKILGAIERLSQLRVPYEAWCDATDAAAFRNEFGALCDALSGGDFTSRERPANPERALEVQVAAADVVARIRNSLRRGITWSATLARHKRDWWSA